MANELRGLGTGVQKGLYTMWRNYQAATQPPSSPGVLVSNAVAPIAQEEYFQPYEEAAPGAMQAGEMFSQVPLFEGAGAAAKAVEPATKLGQYGLNALLDALVIQPTMDPNTPLGERGKQTLIAPAQGGVTRLVGDIGALAGRRRVPLPTPDEVASRVNPVHETADLPVAGEGRLSPQSMAAKTEAVERDTLKRRAADQVDALTALPHDEAAQFKARLRAEGVSQEARQAILAEAHDANAAWERVGGGREIAAPPERPVTPEERAVGEATWQDFQTAAAERRAKSPEATPSPEAARAAEMSARLPGEARIPGNIGPQGEMGGRMMVNEPSGSTKAAAPEPSPYDTQPLRAGEAEAAAAAPGPYDTQPIRPVTEATATPTSATPANWQVHVKGAEPPYVTDANGRRYELTAEEQALARTEGSGRERYRANQELFRSLGERHREVGEAVAKDEAALARIRAAAGESVTPPRSVEPPVADRYAGERGSAQMVPAGSGGQPPRGGPPARKVFEPEPLGEKPPQGPPSPAVDEFFGRTGQAPSKARSLLPRIINQIKETFVTSHKLRGEHTVYDPKLGEVGASTSFADARNRIRLLADVSRHASAKTIEALKPVVEGLNAKQLDILRRKVFIEDLLETSRRGEKTPLTAADLKAEKARLDPLIAADPKLQRAYARDQELWQAAAADLVKRGKLSEADVRRGYIHHEVMDYISQEGAGLGRPYSLRNVARKYLKRRLGSTKDIYTNYLDVRYRSLAKHIRDNMIDDAVKEIADRYAVPRAKAEKLGYVPFSTEELWQVAGRTSHDRTVMKLVTDISRDLDPGLAQQMLSGAEERLLKRKVFIHPDLAETLGKLRDIYQEPGTLAKATGWWKQAMLNKNPLRYNFNNMIGDAERGWNALPEMFRDGGKARMQRVIRDMKDAARGKPSMDYKLAEQHSVIDSGEVYHEIGSIKEAEAFKHLNEADKASWRRPLATISGALRRASTARENLLRLQAFYTNLDRMRSGLPLAEGVSDIRGMSDPVAAAAKISREALGDYGDMTPREAKLRRGLLPFYSWLKINTSFWPTLFARRGAGAGAKAAARLAPRAALKTGLAVAKATAIYGAAAAFNNTVQREQEESLPEDVRRRFHINTGLRDRKGRWITITEPTAMSDFMDSIGVEGVTTDVAQLLRGQMSARDLASRAADRALAPVRKIASRVTPAITGPVEAVTGKRFYPDPLAPSPSTEHNPLARLASGMGFGEFWPPREAIDTYKRSLVELGAIGIRRYDEGLSALRNTEDRVRRFRAAKGFVEDAPSEGPLTAFNRALLYALADKNYTRAAVLLKKTTPAAFSKYLTARDPMVRIPVKMRDEFAATLSEYDRKQIRRAKAFLDATGGALVHAAPPR